ncbi:terminase TerL endonuclease subunit [Corynebacterium gerontici]|uniref:Phage Terminase n=1 Tax=Corynebacterium gerontici TaxID=2079234 RepID=A0A3G6IZG7_9CORY|nr:terminase TerL endonuclease subunit [Corynebacterium gerontici]AZA11087.1 Phage Terminase [Corynebacterium gerontici]
MGAGPKKAAELSPLPWKPRSKGADQLRLFCSRYLRVPRGKGAGSPLLLRDWQVEMCRTLLDDPETSLACWVIPRGNGKSGLAAAIGLHHIFMSGIEGARCAIVAQDERRATAMLKTAARMVELNEELAKRCKVYIDRIEIPATDSKLLALPAEAQRIEGEDLTLGIVDEIGFVRKDSFEATIFSAGKREGSKVLAIGTPSPARFKDISPLWDLVVRGRANAEDRSFKLVEFGADPSLPIDDPETWAIANPAYGDWLSEKAIRGQLPPTTRELEFRRARLGQWVEQSAEPAVPPDAWKRCSRPDVRIPRGSKVVLSLDGSMNNDSTAILVGSVSSRPHFQIGGLWEPHKQEEGYEVPVLEVEDRIRELAATFKVVEVVADPFRWQRSLQVLSEDGLPVHKFPQSTQRLSPATQDLRTAVSAELLTHSGESELSAHVLRASVEESQRGMKLSKPSRGQKIDLAACLIMAYSRCSWLGSPKNRKARTVRGFRR